VAVDLGAGEVAYLAGPDGVIDADGVQGRARAVLVAGQGGDRRVAVVGARQVRLDGREALAGSPGGSGDEVTRVLGAGA
jgi:hypothetical protein